MATPPARPQFTPTRLREGYDIGQVDAFIADVSARMALHPPTVTAPEVGAVRFRPVRLKRGYDMGEVDTYLDSLQAALGGAD